MFATRKILIQLLMQRIIRHACIYNGRMTSLVYHYVLYPWKPVTGGYLHACVGACVGACYAYILYVCMQQLSFRFAYMQCTSVQRQSWHRIWYSQRSKQPNRCRRILLRGLLNAIPHGLPDIFRMRNFPRFPKSYRMLLTCRKDITLLVLQMTQPVI